MDLLKSFEAASIRLQTQYSKAQNEIADAFAFYRALLDERKNELLKELESMYTTRHLTLSVVTQRVRESMDQIQMADQMHRLISDSAASPPQKLVFKKILETRLQEISTNVPDASLATTIATDLEFVSNFAAMQTAVRNTLGYIRAGGINDSVEFMGKQATIAPIARPLPTQQYQPLTNGYHHHPNSNGYQNSSEGRRGNIPQSQSISIVDTSHISKRISNTPTPPSSYNQLDHGRLATYENWSNASETSSYDNGHGGREFSPPSFLPSSCGSSTGTGAESLLLDLGSTLAFPRAPIVQRQKMIYHCKFGEFGAGESQFTEPSGVTVNGNNEIIVADTNNHRIQIFDREGRFKFQFGECGKRDGQLLYPNRVAVVKPSGDIVITERSPTHQIQIYNQYGQFVRKFGANVLQHPRGVTVDSQGRIIVVECKVMRVIIFDQMGTVLNKFGCSKHLEFPNGVVVNDRNEIFISDNRAHCVKVFSYEGVFLRQIGGEGLTNYPIGVGINANGEIIVADNHNNFNITVFTQDGQLVSALESKVKHAQCFDVALMDSSVVLASKDYRLYIYTTV